MRSYSHTTKPLGTLLFLMALFFYSKAQYDSVWLLNQNILDFRGGQSNVTGLPFQYQKGATASITTKAGNSLLFNEENIYDINLNPLSNTNLFSLSSTFSSGQPSLFLNTELDSIFYLLWKPSIYSTSSGNGVSMYLFLFKINLNLNNGRGDIYTTDTIFWYQDSLAIDQMTATRHANGKDWWLLCHEEQSKKYYKIWYSNKVELIDTQYIGNYRSDVEQSNSRWSFSPDGSMFASVIGSSKVVAEFTVSWKARVELYDFDRCTGKLSNYREIFGIDTVGLFNNDNVCNSTCFSPDGTKLYFSTYQRLYQYDIASGTKTVLMDSSSSLPNAFALADMLQVPDGRIIVGRANFGDLFLSTIEKPNEFGLACDFKFYSIPTPNFSSHLPNMAFYNLGAVPLIEGSKSYRDTICEGDIYEKKVDSFPNATYKWYKEGVLKNTAMSYRIAPTENEVYLIHIRDEAASCSDRWDTLYLHVKPLPCVPLDTSLQLVLPTAFTPNGDGQNETFYPIGNKSFALSKFTIYNRWGEIVHNAPQPWDGKYKNEAQPQDAYWFIIEYEGKINKGVVTLLR